MNIFSTYSILIQIFALAVAIIGHEIMHGYTAYRYGDNTAKLQGRLNINPAKHIDLMGSIIVPAVLFYFNAPFLFGWAKPVPIDIKKIHSNGGYMGLVVVSLAGIAYNFACFMIFAQLYKISSNQILQQLSGQLMIYNLVLGVFNLFPIPPLDGANTIVYLAKYFNINLVVIFYEKIWQFGFFIIIGFLSIFGGREILVNIISTLLRAFF